MRTGKRVLFGLLGWSVLLLCGCSALLERSYSASEPHYSRFYESEAAGTLRAENRQDIVNDLLLLIGQHTENATLRLYNFDDDLTVSDTLEQAAVEIQQETPMGAYAVSYITSSAQAQRGYYEVKIQIGYRRTPEQIQAVVNATTAEAVYSLLVHALDEERTELAVRIGYWSGESRNLVEDAMTRVQEDRRLTGTAFWRAEYYPNGEQVGLIEFLLEPVVPGSDGAELPESDGTAADTVESGDGAVPATASDGAEP